MEQDAIVNIEPADFWFVWTKTGRVPRYAHSTRTAADTEALRLAHLHPGKKFIVLKAEMKISVQPMASAEEGAA